MSLRYWGGGIFTKWFIQNDLTSWFIKNDLTNYITKPAVNTFEARCQNGKNSLESLFLVIFILLEWIAYFHIFYLSVVVELRWCKDSGTV